VALSVKDQIVKHGKVTRGRIGVTVQEVNATLAESFGLDRPRGALVSSVEPGSPGEKAGVQVGDIILKYNGRAIDRSGELPMLVAETAPGRSGTIEVWRNRSVKALSVTTYEGKARGEDVADNDDAAPGSGRLGLAVRPLDPQERGAARVRGGVVVEQASGAAARAGIQAGDVVLSVNGSEVKSVDDLRDHVRKAGKRIALLIAREGQQLFVPVELG
jgi:serine protease Do